jgi:hypothetical protein
MKYFLYFAYFLLSHSLAIRVGCFENATFSGISLGVWLNKTSDCHFCNCYMLITNSSAFNCYKNAFNNTDCLIFSNYSSATGGIQLVAGQNGSSACFVQFPPTPAIQSSSYNVLLLLNSIFSYIKHLIFCTTQQFQIDISIMFAIQDSYHFSCSCHHIIDD